MLNQKFICDIFFVMSTLVHDVNRISSSKEFTLLHNASSILSSSLNLQDSVSKIFELLNQEFGFMKAVLTIVKPYTEDLNIKVAYGITPKEIESKSFQRWKEITKKVLDSKEPVIIPHLDKDSMLIDEYSNSSMTEESFICFPLILSNEKFGTLSIDFPFSSEEELYNTAKLVGVITLMIAQEVRLKRLLDNEKEILRIENLQLKDELKEKYQIHNMIGKSGAIIDVYENIRQVASSNATVMIRGESGTGKELVAHAIHYLSSRSSKPFIKVNCGALPASLIESELFGYEKGAFTDAIDTKIGRFESANGGTIFLDEVGELPPEMQVKLLRVLQEKEIIRVGGVHPLKIDVRVVTATNKNLEEELKKGQIREDFYYRLNVFPIFIPSLKERKSDILLLAEHFLDKFSKENNKKIIRLTSSAIDLLHSYNWPGNVRELENCIERAVILCNSDTIQPTHLPATLQRADIEIMSDNANKSFKDMTESFEKKIIVDTLHKFNGNVSKAAKELQTTSRIIGYKINQYQINPKEIKQKMRSLNN